MTPPPPPSTLFPYTTLFRSQVLEHGMPRFFRRLAEGVFDEDDVRRRAVELADFVRSEEHTSELQSRGHLVCRLLLEKKKRRDSGRASAGHGRLRCRHGEAPA